MKLFNLGLRVLDGRQQPAQLPNILTVIVRSIDDFQSRIGWPLLQIREFV